MANQITYTAYIETIRGRRVWRRSTDYDKLAHQFETFRNRHFAKTEKWLGGYILSYA